ncbi:MAG TPA: hypothetical protein VK388_02025 [Pyrinomonadaceae bacterium]|nr:hypothetical protein [Pyrinomonadaceae bacterium]
MINKTLKTTVLAVSLLCIAATTAQADLKLKFKITENAREGESTFYFKGRRQRSDFSFKRPDGTPAAAAYIYQCDLKRQIALDIAKRVFYEHQILPIQEYFARAEAERTHKPQPRRAETYDGRWLETFTVVDTGERREMFGYTARRIKTTLTLEATPPSACPQTPLRKESDGWYVDLLYGTFCSYDISGFDEGELTAVEQTRCTDYHLHGEDKRRYGYERRQVGAARFGFALALTVKSYSDEGSPTIRTREAVEITDEELDASLFEIPAGYTKFKPKKRSLASRALSLFGKR